MSSPQNNLSTPFIPPNERRLFVRVRKEVELNYRVMGAPMEEAPSPTRDVSAGGLRIATSEYLPFDTQVLLTASIRDTGVAFHLNGHVVWSVKHDDTGECEAGLAFTGIDPMQQENILALIASELPSTDGAERRRFIRMNEEVQLEIRVAGALLPKWHAAATRDISMGGFMANTSQSCKVNTALKVRSSLSGSGEPNFEADAIVVRCQPAEEGGKGFVVSGRFQHIPPGDFERLMAFISSRTAEPPIGPVRK